MGFRVALGLIAVGFLSVLLRAQLPAPLPKIWDDSALADWATPIASLNVRPAHYSSAEYYAVPGDNLRTYPVYHPDDEPPGYWEELQKKEPEPLVDLSKIQTTAEWIAAGERAFHEIDTIWMRTNDPDRPSTRSPQLRERVESSRLRPAVRRMQKPARRCSFIVSVGGHAARRDVVDT
jgi:hypothetical protein